MVRRDRGKSSEGKIEERESGRAGERKVGGQREEVRKSKRGMDGWREGGERRREKSEEKGESEEKSE